MLCLSIAQTRTADLLGTLATYRGQADLYEIRIDRMADLDIPAILSAGKKNLVFADLRGPEPTEEFHEAMKAGVPYICAPPSVIGSVATDKPRKTKLIAACHDDAGTPSNLTELADRAFASGAEMAKIVTKANCVADNFAVLDYLKDESRPVIAFCSGELGAPSRILASAFGSPMTFCCADKGAKTAEGQLPVSQMRTLFDTRRLKDGFALYGVAGYPLEQSLSPLLFNTVFARRKTNAIYLPLLATDANDLIDTVRSAGIRGLSVTLPHKKAVYELLDGVDKTAAQCGAVNTIVNHDGNLVGHNTDQDAALDLIPSDLSGVSVTLLGAGGSARSIARALVKRGATLTICARTAERAEQLAESVSAAWRPWAARESIDTDFWINATPIGMVPDSDRSPVSAGVLRGGETVFDMVYNPPETKLLRMAWQTGCKVFRGMEMFLAQAAAQYELWFGERPAPEELRKAVEQEP